jgi:hypothetical protein
MKMAPAAVALLAMVGSLGAYAGADNPLARYITLSPPDCTMPGTMVTESALAPLQVTYMRVQHMGDPGTAELEGEVAHAVTWNVGELTGFTPPPLLGVQRGYRDAGPPTAASAFQLWCDGGGFLINTFEFSHASPLSDEGPNVNIARDFDPPIPAFQARSGLLLEADVRVPWLRNQAPVFAEGTAQVGFSLYFHDRRSGIAIAQLVALFDNRPPGRNGSGVEGYGSDGFTAFISSPLAARDGLGNAVRFVTATPFAPQMQYETPWGESRHFRALITYDNFAAALALLRSGPQPQISPAPEDYVVTLFGVGGEVIPGTGNANNVTLGASVRAMTLSAVPNGPVSLTPPRRERS